MSYIEETGEATMRRIEEALGRKLAEEDGQPYPIPPAIVGPGKQPPDPTRYYQRYYRRFRRHRSGGVMEVDERMRSWDGTSVILDDSTEQPIAIVERTRAELSQDSRNKLDADGVEDVVRAMEPRGVR